VLRVEGDVLRVWKTDWVMIEMLEIVLKVLACHEIDISYFHSVAFVVISWISPLRQDPRIQRTVPFSQVNMLT
jgi:hypothetical protein